MTLTCVVPGKGLWEETESSCCLSEWLTRARSQLIQQLEGKTPLPSLVCISNAPRKLA